MQKETEDKVLEVVMDGKHFQGRNKTFEHFKDSSWSQWWQCKIASDICLANKAWSNKQ